MSDERNVAKGKRESGERNHGEQEQSSSGGLSSHVTSFIGINAMLWVINISTGVHFPWAALVSLSWGVGLASHIQNHFSKRRRKIREGQGRSRNKVGQDTKGNKLKEEKRINGYFLEAEKLRASLLKEMAENREFRDHWGPDLEDVLNNFIRQIKDLIQINRELEETLASSGEEEVRRELGNLKKKKDSTEKKMLIKEYDRSINQWEHQLKTISDLRDQKEIIDLRLKSSITLIRQLKLDASRIKNLHPVEEPFSLKEIRDKSRELTEYMEFLRQGYESLEE